MLPLPLYVRPLLLAVPPLVTAPVMVTLPVPLITSVWCVALLLKA